MVQKIIEKIGVIILVSGLITFHSCYYDVIIEEDETTTNAKSFSNDVLPILKSTCASCHDGTVALPDLRDVNAYQSITQGKYITVSDPENSIIILKVQSGHPYTNALSEKEIQRIVDWIKEGAENN